MQKISLFHLFILQIQSILESHHQTGHIHFWPCSPPRIFNHLLICVKLYQHANIQLVASVFSWDTVNFRVQRLDWLHSFLAMLHQKLCHQFLIFLNFLKISTCKKWGCFIDWLLRNAWFKNPAIWMAESILVYISGTTFFPNRRFVQEHSK